MALNLQDCERMIETAAKNKVRLGVVFQNRYHPAHVAAKRYESRARTGCRW
jgi:predicted dehydrogenase